jgi:hypothetical protein
MKRGRKPTPKKVGRPRGRRPRGRVIEYTAAVSMLEVYGGDVDRVAQYFHPPLDPEVVDDAARGKVRAVNEWRAKLLAGLGGSFDKSQSERIKAAWARGAYKNRKSRWAVYKKGPTGA